jgi:hypothetical protein
VRSKSYALVLAALAATVFIGVAGANVIIDPWRVFGVTPLPPTVNFNDRYRSYRDYEAAPQRYDALFLSSSRGRVFSLPELSRHMGNVEFADFSVSYGRLEDHLGVLNFVLRDNAARGTRLKAVFLLIEVESFGERPAASDALQLLQPPAVSGESTLRFWWKNLIAVQFAAWRRTVQERTAPPSGVTRAPWGDRPVAPVLPAGPIEAGAAASARTVDQPRYADDLRNWARIASLCRDSSVTLVAALSPVTPRRLKSYDQAVLDSFAGELSRSAPVWDFTGKAEPSNRPELWFDDLHFFPIVADMMVGRMFGDEVPAEWTKFGRVLGW